jgi:hypothetical protein
VLVVVPVGVRLGMDLKPKKAGSRSVRVFVKMFRLKEHGAILAIATRMCWDFRRRLTQLAPAG